MVVSAAPAWAQLEDGFNLPSELYVLTNQGRVQQYGLGSAGITTVTPESDFVVDFGLAPDGNWLAYRTEQVLTLSNIYQPESSMELDSSASVPPVRGVGDTLVWSPAGDAIAYSTLFGAKVAFITGTQPVFATTTQGPLTQLSWSPGGSYLAAEAEGNIWWIYRRDSGNMTLTSAIPSSVGLAWVSDSELVFAPETGGLLRMNLADANRQSMLLDDTWTYRLPYERPNGDLVVFGRQKGSDSAPEFGRLIGLAANSPQVSNLSDVSVDTSDLQWAPGGELLVALRGGVLLLVVPTAQQGLPLPISDVAAYSWGPPAVERADSLPEAVGGFFRAISLDDLVQVWRVGSDGVALPVTGAEADVTAYAVAPDGRRIAYASAGEIRLQPLNAAEPPLVLAEIGAQQVRDLTFSPDGGRVAYTLDTDAEHLEGGIYIIPVGGGEPELLLANGPQGEQPVYAPPFYHSPQFAPNVNALLVTESGSETTTFVLVDLNTGERLRAGSYDAAFWLSDGRMVAYGNGIGIGDPPPTTGLFVIATDALDRPVQFGALAAPLVMRAVRETSAGRLRIAASDNVPGPSALRVFDIAIATGEQTPVANAGFITHPVFSRNGQLLAGVVNPGELLTLYDLTSGEQVALSAPSHIEDIQWSAR
ncbi:MAG: hypothetical protein H6672_21565 [Anaerolineaceae bacterium]|nr:hypothetical protein [Anaerolineaceae bacterium]